MGWVLVFFSARLAKAHDNRSPVQRDLPILSMLATSALTAMLAHCEVPLPIALQRRIRLSLSVSKRLAEALVFLDCHHASAAPTGILSQVAQSISRRLRLEIQDQLQYVELNRPLSHTTARAFVQSDEKNTHQAKNSRR